MSILNTFPSYFFNYFMIESVFFDELQGVFKINTSH